MEQGGETNSLLGNGLSSFRWLNGRVGVLIFIAALLVLGLEMQHAKKISSADVARLAVGRERLRMLFAHECQQTFLDQRVDVACVTDKHDLIIIGAPVDRVFANQFIQTPDIQRTLKKLGFTTATFSNGTNIGDRYIERFDVAY